MNFFLSALVNTVALLLFFGLVVGLIFLGHWIHDTLGTGFTAGYVVLVGSILCGTLLALMEG